MPKIHGRTEASVLAFTREKLHEGVHLARIGLRRDEHSTFHTHTVTRDTFYVMAGRLTVEIRVQSSDPARDYRVMRAGRVDDANISVQETMHRVVLAPGDICVIEPGVAHCTTNLDPEPCHFLCIEGVGEYDFKEVGT